MADTLVTDCFGQLTDSGGEDDPYGNNEFLTFTVDAGSPLEVFFLAPVDIEPAAPGPGQPFDYLILFDGPDALSPVLDTLYGNLLAAHLHHQWPFDRALRLRRQRTASGVPPRMERQSAAAHSP